MECIECKNTVSKLQSSFLCEICVTNSVDTVLAPCGHSICSSCVSQLTRSKYL